MKSINHLIILIVLNISLETKKQELKNINEKHKSQNELLLNEYNIKKMKYISFQKYTKIIYNNFLIQKS